VGLGASWYLMREMFTWISVDNMYCNKEGYGYSGHQSEHLTRNRLSPYADLHLSTIVKRVPKICHPPALGCCFSSVASPAGWQILLWQDTH
jgi:hypothetical protein